MRKEQHKCYTFLFQKRPNPEKIRSLGGSVYFVGRHCPMVSAIVNSPDQLNRIRKVSDLVHTEEDFVIRVPQPIRVGVISRKTFLKVLTARPRMRLAGQFLTWNIRRVWRRVPPTIAGAGVRVGVIDTGIDLNHPDLLPNIKGGVNLIRAGSLPQDDNGHGTHVAGIIGARSNGIGVVGVTPSVSLYAIKVLNGRGTGTLTNLIRGIEWGIDNGMHILNISLSGGRSAPAALVQAVNAAAKRGILVVASAGNSGNSSGWGDTVEVPARIPSVLAVAALDQRNRRASFSSTGSELDLAAPGDNILSTYKNGRYAVLSGTSMAAPHVSGVAAYYRQQGGSPSRVRQLLAQRAIRQGPRFQYGAGLVQAR